MSRILNYINAILLTIIDIAIVIVVLSLLFFVLANFMPEIREKIPSLYFFVDLVFSYLEKFFKLIVNLFH